MAASTKKINSVFVKDDLSDSTSGDSYDEASGELTVFGQSVKIETESESNMTDVRAYHIHKFNGTNYQLWKMQMEIFMAENELDGYILGRISRTEENHAVWDKKNIQAKAFLMRGLELDQLKYMSDCTTAAEMWSRLRTVHAEKSDQSAQILLDRFINAKMEDDEKMSDYIAKVTSLAQRLKEMDLEQKQPMIIAKVMGSLPQRYDHVGTAWYTVPKNEQTMDRLTDHLVNEEALLNMRTGEGNGAGSEALSARGGKRPDNKQRDWNKDKQDERRGPWRQGKCNYCGFNGHWARECRKRLGNKNASQSNVVESTQTHTPNSNVQSSNNQNTNTATTDQAYLYAADTKQSDISEQDSWYADSGATEHMCSRKECFKNYEAYPERSYTVRVGDGALIDAKGRGDVEVYTNNSEKVIHTLKNVLHVPDIQKNLLSISRSTQKGMKVTFEEGGNSVVFMKDNKITLTGVKHSNLYKLNLRPVKVAEANVAISDSIRVWHERLGHVNFKTLKQMRDQKTVDDLKFKDTEGDLFCESCVYAKQHRKSFPKTGTRATSPGEIFHADLCGKMSTKSLGGANFFLLLKDDFSRYCYVYFLKEKSDVFENLKLFYAEVQADGHSIKRLRTDGGKEFCNGDVREFLLSKGIKHEVTTPYAPEQNGFIERQNRTEVKSGKAMIHARNLPLNMWAEATNTAVYVKNRTASETINGATPFEKWFGKKPSVSHLRILGCDCYVLVPKN